MSQVSAYTFLSGVEQLCREESLIGKLEVCEESLVLVPTEV